MCGIVGGWCRPYEPMQAGLPGAVSTLSHRGPDDRGMYFDPGAGVGLGHCRLSVIDLSVAGRQPMASDDQAVQIVYNGEVYNFQELRSQLEKAGHRFQTGTDTEVVLKAYLEWGTACPKHFVGMFALAIWDKRHRRFFLARDRLGIKPLYYHHAPGRFLFGSELKALTALGIFPRAVDPEAVPLYLHYQYVPAPRTIFRDTFKLPPGHFAVFEDDKLTIAPYWEIPPEAPSQDSPRAAIDRLDALVTEAVSDRLVSDVPIGALLSGGIDSSLVVAVMQKIRPDPVRTFTIAFEAAGYDESRWAARVANYLGTRHTEFTVTAEDALKVIPQLPEIYDEPFADSSAIPTLLVSRLARSQVTVALSGDGGDEFFGGYKRYWATHFMAEAFRHVPSGIRQVAGRMLGRISPETADRWYQRWERVLPTRFHVKNMADKWNKLATQMQQFRLEELYRTAVCIWNQDDVQALTGLPVSEGGFEAVLRHPRGWPIRTRVMRVDQKTYLPDAMLTKVDRASMAASLEVRVPLLDHRLVEYAARLAEAVVYADGSGKYPLRALLRKYLPAELFEREKMGFGAPIGQWIRTDLKEMVCDYLAPERLKREGMFDAGVVQYFLKEHLSGRANHQHRLWALLMWEMWRERWLM